VAILVLLVQLANTVMLAVAVPLFQITIGGLIYIGVRVVRAVVTVVFAGRAVAAMFILPVMAAMGVPGRGARRVGF